MKAPRHIVVLVADSLRYDTAVRSGAQVTGYMRGHGVWFEQARSAGCWTLPATASMFTGTLPHEHRATCRTRTFDDEHGNLAVLLGEAGYTTFQLTNNGATTIFGLERGFDRIEKFYSSVQVRANPFYWLLVAAGKPRIRARLLRGDWLMQRMSDDLEASRSWVVSCCAAQLERSRQILAEHRSERLFLFINLMDTHYPYHVAPTFRLTAAGLSGRTAEARSLFHFANQSRLVREQSPIDDAGFARLLARQHTAWDRIAGVVDDFVGDVHGEHTTVVFCSDHGDCFGEHGFEYHFGNVTEAGNRVPLVWLRCGETSPATIAEPVSMRDLYGAICAEAGIPSGKAGIAPFHLVDEPERSCSVTEAFWYDKAGRTRPEHRLDQLSFVAGRQRFVHCNGRWLAAGQAVDGHEPELSPLGRTNPIEELDLPSDHRRELRRAFAGFLEFCATI